MVKAQQGVNEQAFRVSECASVEQEGWDEGRDCGWWLSDFVEQKEEEEKHHHKRSLFFG